MADKRDRKAGLKDEEDSMSLATTDRDDDRDDDREERRRVARAEAEEPRRGFFDIYKPTQGTLARRGTAVAAGLLVLWCAGFLSNKMTLVGTRQTSLYYQVGVAVAVILIGGYALWRLLAINRRVCDFLIATEGEMKKVNWTSRREIIGSTKVVIFVVLALAALLFVVDISLMAFFTEIRVLRIMPEMIQKLLGGSK